MDHFAYRERTLHCEDVPVPELAEKYGTPLFVYSEATLLHHLREVRTAFARIESAVGAGRMEGVRVQRMIEGGRETVIGMTNDRLFGPIVMFGLGGIHVEVLKDVVFRVAPISAIDAAEMVRSLRGDALLAGVRGESPVAFDVLEEAIQRVSQLVLDHPAIAEMDVNPFLAFPEPERCVAVDGRIRLRNPLEEA